MAVGLQLTQRLTQSLVLAPQLQQSLALLQAPTLELKALVEQELQQNLQALARGWRRAVWFIVPGVIGGVALALALTWWLTDAGLMRALIMQSAAEFGSGNSSLVQPIATALLGAAVGGLIARWFATALE